MFAWQNAPGGDLELPGLAVAPLDGAEEDAADVRPVAERWRRAAGGSRARLDVRHRALRRGRRWSAAWATCAGCCEAMVADEHGRVERLELLSAAERAPGGGGVERDRRRVCPRRVRPRAVRSPGGAHARRRRRSCLRGRDAELRGAERAREPPGAPPAPLRRRAGGAGGDLPGARAGDGRRHAGRAQGRRRVRAAGPRVSRASGWRTCWRMRPCPCW